MKKTTAIESIIVLYAILFLYTAVAKWIDYSVFKEQLAVSPILAPFASIIAVGLPWAEIIVTILLIVPRWRLKGFFASLLLMSSFTIYIAATLTFSDDMPCSCGGIIAEMSWTQHLIFNTFFICLSVIGIRLTRRLINQEKQQWSSEGKTNWEARPERI